MSSEFIDVFFPLSSSLLRTHRPDVFRRFFPPELQHQCARPVYEFMWEGRHVAYVSWPTLAPLTLMGVLIGLYGYLQFSQRKSSRPPLPCWSLAMSFYALMNTAALGCHCLMPRSSLWQPSLISLDIAATACCAFSGLYACVSDELSGGLSAKPPVNGARGSRKKHLRNLLCWNGLFNISAFAGLHIPFMAELLYIGTTVVGVVVVGTYMHKRPAVGRQRLWRSLVFTGGLLALGGIPLDAALCRRFGAHVNHVTLLFGGCHLIMVSLFLYVREEVVLRYDAMVAVPLTVVKVPAPAVGAPAPAVGVDVYGGGGGSGWKAAAGRRRRR